jgi:hypothetical protein
MTHDVDEEDHGETEGHLNGTGRHIGHGSDEMVVSLEDVNDETLLVL